MAKMWKSKARQLGHTAEEFFDTAILEPVAITPGRISYAWLNGMPGQRSKGGDGIDWPVNGWAPYLIWRWGSRDVELWHAPTLDRIRIPANHDALKRARWCPKDNVTPQAVAKTFMDMIALYDRNEKSYLVGAQGVADYLEGLESFEQAESPALPVEVDSTSGLEDGPMAEKKTPTKSDESKRKPGSGAWIREQLTAMHKNPKISKNDEALAAEARAKFGGKTGPSDIAWNRNKLRRDGVLPPVERKAKETKKPVAKTPGVKVGQKKTPAKKAAAA